MNQRAVLAEFVSTFALVLVGGGSVVVNDLSGGALGLIGIALANGIVLMTMIYATGHISGAHINPVVTIVMLVTRNIDGKNALGYIIAQLFGATAAAFLLSAVFAGLPANLTLSVPDLAPSVSVGSGILIEILLTFILVFVIFGTSVDSRAPKGFYGLSIGLVLVSNILFAGTLTGAAMNPARVFGPALATGHWDHHIVYWIGPLIGSLAAGLLYHHALLERN